jgi:SGNH domain (fused to AT3 domains)
MASIVAGAIAGGVALASSPPPPGSSAQVRALVAASHKIRRLPADLTPSLADAANDNPGVIYPVVRDGCATLTQCVFGDATGTKTLVLFGDSHAEMWLSAIIPWAVGHGVKVVLLTTLGCPVADVNVWLSQQQGYYTVCNSDRTKDVNLIVGLKPAYVVVADRTAHLKSSPTTYFTNAQWQSGMVTSLSMLKHSGSKLVVLGDITLMNLSSPMCLAAYPTSVQKCANASPNPRAVNRGHQSAEKAAATKESVAYVNPVPWLCTTTCSPVIGNMVAYWDSYHMSNTYAAYLSRVLGAALTTAFK